jgi:hypothetical protein
MTLLVLTVTDLAGYLDDAARALVERGHDEGDALTAARLARAARDADDDTDDAVDAGRLRLDADPSEPPSVIFDGGDVGDVASSPFAALAGLLIESTDDHESDRGG